MTPDHHPAWTGTIVLAGLAMLARTAERSTRLGPPKPPWDDV